MRFIILLLLGMSASCEKTEYSGVTPKEIIVRDHTFTMPENCDCYIINLMY